MELQPGESLRLSLKSEQLTGFAVEAPAGGVGVAVTSFQPFDSGAAADTGGLEIRRSYYVDHKPAGVLHDGDLVNVVLEYRIAESAGDGCQRVSDLLPSGLRLVTRLAGWSAEEARRTHYPYAVDGQRVEFCVYRRDTAIPGAMERNRGETELPEPAATWYSLSYYARVISTGRFTAEPALIQSERAPEHLALTPSAIIEIR